jgi:hypothetical protein
VSCGFGCVLAFADVVCVLFVALVNCVRMVGRSAQDGRLSWSCRRLLLVDILFGILVVESFLLQRTGPLRRPEGASGV